MAGGLATAMGGRGGGWRPLGGVKGPGGAGVGEGPGEGVLVIVGVRVMVGVRVTVGVGVLVGVLVAVDVGPPPTMRMSAWWVSMEQSAQENPVRPIRVDG